MTKTLHATTVADVAVTASYAFNSGIVHTLCAENVPLEDTTVHVNQTTCQDCIAVLG